MTRKQCPCCGFYTVNSEDEVIVDICEVCFWQYDKAAHDYPDKNIGANHISLNEAQNNFKKFGACKKELKTMVREPLKEELGL